MDRRAAFHTLSILAVMVCLAGALLAAGRLPAQADGGAGGAVPGATTELVSRSSAGILSDFWSQWPSVSTDGRYIAFFSNASTLVAGDGDYDDDVFVHDRQTGQTEIVSIGAQGVYGNGDSHYPDISGDGRYVVFSSDATNLVIEDQNSLRDIFVHDRETGLTELVSVSSSGQQGNQDSYHGSVSNDGRYVAFSSDADNLVAGDANSSADVFVFDRQTQEIELVSVSSQGGQSNGFSIEGIISANGRCVVFSSGASNLVAGDTNAMPDIFVHDRQTGATERISVSSSGEQANQQSYLPWISADGRFVSFTSAANNLVADDTNEEYDVFVRDRRAGYTDRVMIATHYQEMYGVVDVSSISDDGRYVAFNTGTNQWFAGDANGARDDVYLYDRWTGITEMVSVSSSGVQGNLGGVFPAISPNGRVVAFQSSSTNLVAEPTNDTLQVYVRSLPPPAIRRYSPVVIR